MEKYDITGMSCAACQAHVEKAVNNVPGVNSCAVSLLTNSMTVEGSASPESVIKAVEGAEDSKQLCINDLKNLASANIPAKVQHSTDVLRSCGIPIDSGAILLIKKSPIVQQQRRWLEQRLLAQGHYQVKTVDEFYKLYFCA